MIVARGSGPGGHCDRVLLVQAELDGELDAAQTADLQAHRAKCRACRAAEQELTALRTLIVPDELYRPVPHELRKQLFTKLLAAQQHLVSGPVDLQTERAAEPRAVLSWVRGWRQSALAFSVGAGCVAGLAFLMLSSGEQSLIEQIVAGHVRALQPGHLEDIMSTDHHAVRPWFDGRIDFSPPVNGLEKTGFQLEGGRLDYISGRPVAALVYRRANHVINLFVWPRGDKFSMEPELAERNGYGVLHWAQDGMEIWTVSDVDPVQLSRFVQSWRQLP
jgi:anti-sigma factor RsiW